MGDLRYARITRTQNSSASMPQQVLQSAVFDARRASPSGCDEDHFARWTHFEYPFGVVTQVPHAPHTLPLIDVFDASALQLATIPKQLHLEFVHHLRALARRIRIDRSEMHIDRPPVAIMSPLLVARTRHVGQGLPLFRKR